jgi:hypothetical protein
MMMMMRERSDDVISVVDKRTYHEDGGHYIERNFLTISGYSKSQGRWDM